MSEQQRPKKVVIQEVLRAPATGLRLIEGEDLSQTNRLLAQLQAAAPSAKKDGATNGGAPPKK